MPLDQWRGHGAVISAGRLGHHAKWSTASFRPHIESGTTDDIIRHIEAGRINLGFIRPVENVGSLCFFSIVHERYLLAVARESPLSAKSEIEIEDLRGENIISFSRQSLS